MLLPYNRLVNTIYKKIMRPLINFPSMARKAASRKKKMLTMRGDGKTLAEIGDKFKISRQRVWVILNKAD
jgi:Mor family transcriptional regulator